MVEPRFDVTTFGEMMLRLSVPTGQRLQTATNMNVYPAGAEANVISLLARLDRKTSWNGTLPDNKSSGKQADDSVPIMLNSANLRVGFK
jgi:hypothetical protein